MTLAYHFPELASVHSLGGDASAVLSESIVELLDGEGMPHCDYLPLLRPLLACWTRSAILAKQGGKETRLSKEARIQYTYLVEQALRLSRADGRQVLGTNDNNAVASSFERSFLEAAVELARDDQVFALASLLRPSPKSPRLSASDASLPDSVANNAEWAETAILRANWTPASPNLVVTYADKTLHSELNVSGKTVWSGKCQPSVSINGSEVRTKSHWEQVCWASDRDADYLELEMNLQKDWKLQRQMLLSRQDYILFVADAVLGESEARIEYTSCLPLFSDVVLQAHQETRDGHLVGGKRLATVFPLALPEWRTDKRFGELSQTTKGLVLEQHAKATNLYAPLVFDLHPRRLRKPATWRHLTVAERLEIVPRDVAAAYRVQAGKAQWVFYRALSSIANRTFLGQNVSTEFYAGRFLTSGETETLMEIE